MTVYGPWKCKSCKKEFLTEKALYNHTVKKHGKPVRRNKDDEDQRR